MPKILKLIGLLIIAFSFSSCIELVEEIKINADLSGKYHLYLKHKGLGFLFNSFSQDLDLRELEKGLNTLKQQKGISNLARDINPRKGKFSIQFDFADANSLTHAFYASLGAKKQFYHKSFLKVNKNRIKRPNLTPYLIKYIESTGLLKQIPSEQLFGYIQYRYRVISPRNIKSAIPTASNISYREYNQVYPLQSLLIQKHSIKSTIRIQK